MALINLNIDSLKKDGGGILNKLISGVSDGVENKLENAVDNLISGSLKKVGLSSSIASDISSRFGDAFSKGAADRYFNEFNSETSRVSPEEIRQNVFGGGSAETYTDAITRASNLVAVRGAEATLQYPAHLGKYYMTMKFAEYSRPAPEAPAVLEFKQAYALPVPRELKEQINISVDESDQGTKIGGIANLGTSAFGGGGIGTAIRDQAGALLYSAAVQAAGQYGQVLSQFAGAVPNPHVQAIFSGIPLRSHRFDWTFSPRNAAESAILQRLIFSLKANSLPSYTRLGTAALQYPLLCKIELFPWAERTGAELIKFKPAFLKSVDINYAPQGMPSFFAGTTLPTMVSFSLEFLETEIHTSNDYGRQGDSNIDKNVADILNGLDRLVQENFNGLSPINEFNDLISGVDNIQEGL